MKQSKSKKIFLLDTSVLLFDHLCMTKFKNHDIILPVTVLEELDKFKVGDTTKNYEARNVIKYIDSIFQSEGANKWIPQGGDKGNLCIGIVETGSEDPQPKRVFGKSNDNKIIEVALFAKAHNPKSKVILVTKDINLRIKARTLGLISEDYLSGKIEDLSKIKERKTIINDLDHSIIETIYSHGFIEDISSIVGDSITPVPNSYYVLNSPTGSVLTKYEGASRDLPARLVRVEKKIASNIKPKNFEQTFALDSLLDPNIKLIAIEGMAGSGKTLLSLAAALHCRKEHKEIILARPLVALNNREIGFLPGDEKDKINPYMQPLYDNLKFIKSQHRPESRKAKNLDSLEEDGVLSIMALAFIRGRSISDTYFIIDEAQNLTPHEVKTIVTRAGENTKVVFTGDINQIDSPYMDSHSNGLTYLIDKFLGEKIFSHVKLTKGERSELANIANRLL
jgi:PhoH-like ATPase